MALDLSAGTRCFVDANIFYLHFVSTPGLSESCTRLMERIGVGDIVGFTSMQVLSDVIHKVMLAEAAQTFGRLRAGLVPWLTAHPERVRELTRYSRTATQLLEMPLRLLPIDPATLKQAIEISASTGLLTNDALIIALMRQVGLSDIATNDNDFLRVPGLRAWMPRDA